MQSYPPWRQREFSQQYRCYPISMLSKEKEHMTFGGKIFLPPSALHQLSSLNISYPMLFKLTNDAESTSTYAGVLEFTAEEGRVYIPHWMMQTLLLSSGSLLSITNTTLPLGTFVKLKPQSVDFLDITDQRAVLERSFRNFSCLTIGDIFTIQYNHKTFDFLVLEVKPQVDGKTGISIVETDLSVDFDAPVGYVEPEKSYAINKSLHGARTSIANDTRHDVNDGFLAFKGDGVRLSGKSKSGFENGVESVSDKGIDVQKGVPAALILPPGKFFFGYDIVPLKKENDKEQTSSVFTGKGSTLKAARLQKDSK